MQVSKKLPTNAISGARVQLLKWGASLMANSHHLMELSNALPQLYPVQCSLLLSTLSDSKNHAAGIRIFCRGISTRNLAAIIGHH